jgi:hypothetical protein
MNAISYTELPTIYGDEQRDLPQKVDVPKKVEQPKPKVKHLSNRNQNLNQSQK